MSQDRRHRCRCCCRCKGEACVARCRCGRHCWHRAAPSTELWRAVLPSVGMPRGSLPCVLAPPAHPQQLPPQPRPQDPWDNDVWKVAGIMSGADVLFPCAATQAIFTSVSFRAQWVDQNVSAVVSARAVRGVVAPLPGTAWSSPHSCYHVATHASGTTTQCSPCPLRPALVPSVLPPPARHLQIAVLQGDPYVPPVCPSATPSYRPTPSTSVTASPTATVSP
jgi:hypothetical protein